jgi:hypothetical protein
MPDVVGKKLDAAKADIKSAGVEGDVDVEGGGVFGVIQESNWLVCAQSPDAGAATTGTPTLTVDRECGVTSSPTPSSDPSQGNAATPSGTQSASPTAYAYKGPRYDIVAVDNEAGMGVLDQYWVYTDKLDYSSKAYRDELKLIIADVARKAGTVQLIVQIVTDKDIALAEAVSTQREFEAERGTDFVVNTIPKLEKKGWVASYSGGVDYDSGTLSDAETAFAVDWFPNGSNPASEKWRPIVTG